MMASHAISRDLNLQMDAATSNHRPLHSIMELRHFLHFCLESKDKQASTSLWPKQWASMLTELLIQ